MKKWIVFLLLTACLTPTQRREDDLVRTAREWNDDFRWGRFEIAGQTMPPEERQLFLARRTEIGDNLVMADFEVTSIHFLKGSEAATVGVTIGWFMKQEPTLRTTSLVQNWEVRAGHWMMTKQKRVGGDRFPLVPEPVAPSAPSP